MLYIHSVVSISVVRITLKDSDASAWVRGQRKISQVLGVFELLDFTMLGPFFLGERFETYEQFISLIFLFFLFFRTADN
jgi:hypothetical protein